MAMLRSRKVCLLAMKQRQSFMPIWNKTPQKREEFIEFDNTRVRVLRRAFQRSMRMQVKPDGEVLLSTGMSLANKHLVKFLQDSWPWVIKTLAKAEKLRARFPTIQYKNGDTLLVLGLPRSLHYISSHNEASRIRLSGSLLVVEVAKSIWLNFDATASHPEWREPVRRFYEREGRKLLASRVEVFARLMNLAPSGLSFRCQRTRWGSCSSNGRISLNWRLVAAPIAVLDYVVIHELAHLKFPNHSSKFWALVAQFCPDYDNHNKWLRDNHLALDFLL